MTTSRRWLLRGALLGGFVACFGCNPMLFPMFLQGDSFEPPTLKRLARLDKKKEVTVAVLVSSRLSARQELLNVNRELSRKVVERLRELAKAHDDKVVVIEPAKMDRYLANHPGWRDKEPDELAVQLKTDLKVDEVIDIEINSMSLYEANTHELYRGRADIHVALMNTDDLDDRHDTDLRPLYPKETSGGPMMADNETNVLDFRSKFLDTVAKTIANCFCDHPPINQMEDSRQGQGMPD